MSVIFVEHLVGSKMGGHLPILLPKV